MHTWEPWKTGFSHTRQQWGFIQFGRFFSFALKESTPKIYWFEDKKTLHFKDLRWTSNHSSQDLHDAGILFPPHGWGGSDFEFPPQTPPEWGGWESFPPRPLQNGGEITWIFLQNTPIYQNFRRLRRAPTQYNYAKSIFFAACGGENYLFTISGSKSGRLRRNTTTILRQLKILWWNWRKVTVNAADAPILNCFDNKIMFMMQYNNYLTSIKHAIVELT